MAIRLLSVDVDGTITNDRNQITDATVGALRRAMAAGITVALNTGRDLSESGLVLDKIPEIPYLLGCTGAFLMDLRTKERLVTHSLSAELARQAYAVLHRYDTMVNLFMDDAVFNQASELENVEHYYPPNLTSVFATHHVVPSLADVLAARERDIDKLYVVFADRKEQHAAFEEIRALPLFVTEAAFLDMEVTAADADKGTILRDFAARFGYRPEEIMAVGDSGNDVPMLRVAGIGVAMGNARETVKAAADVIAPQNTEDGLAWAIDRLLKGEL